MNLEKEITESISIATALSASLNQQANQIENSSDITKSTESVVTDAQVTVRKMDSYRYRTWYWLRDTLHRLLEPIINTVQGTNPSVVVNNTTTPATIKPLLPTTPDPDIARLVTVNSNNLSTTDNHGQTQLLLQQLSEVSLEIGSELDRQNNMLDTVKNTSENIGDKLEEVNRRNNSLLR
jgi:hypothetical protein